MSDSNVPNGSGKKLNVRAIENFEKYDKLKKMLEELGVSDVCINTTYCGVNSKNKGYGYSMTTGEYTKATGRDQRDTGTDRSEDR